MNWRRLKQTYQKRGAFLYAFFLVFMVPLCLPFVWQSFKTDSVRSLDYNLLLIFYSLSLLGITLGYHRLATHRSFTTYPWIKRILLICGAMAWQGPPAAWASLHIQHHANSDRLRDPHSPVTHSFWYAHCGWIFNHYRPNYRKYGKWLLKDKDVHFVSRYYGVISIGSFMLPLLIGGWQAWLWAGWFRLFLASHATWSVNSLCHFAGSRLYPNVRDNSRNRFLIAILTFGEGWHNNHHQFLRNPKLGHRWYQIDMGYWVLGFMRRCRLAWDLKLPNPQ